MAMQNDLLLQIIRSLNTSPALKMSRLNKDLVFLVLQYLNEEGYKSAARMLEQESGSYFSMEHFEYMVLTGQWEAAEKYLSSFTKYDDNRYSTRIYFEMRKQNFLEALDRDNRSKALEILMKDLKVFASYDEDLFKEMAGLLTISNIRENGSLSSYKDATSARVIIMAELKKVFQANPIFRGKLIFPEMEHQRLRSLINQGLNWQHSKCLNPLPNPEITTLLEDHMCGMPEASTSRPACGPSSSSASTRDPRAFIGEGGGDAVNQGVHDDSEASNEPTLRVGEAEEPGDLPRTVIQTFDLDSVPTSIDFHPIKQSVLLAGTRTGDISLWEVDSGDRIFTRNFEVWGSSNSSMALKSALMKEVSINRVIWSPHGSVFGAAFSKHLVQLYTYASDTSIEQHLEIDAHASAVTDLAFSAPQGQLLVITGGDDKIIKVWDATSGERRFSLEGHDAPVCSLCPNSKNGIEYIFSTSVDGKIKTWLYDDRGARVDCYAPSLGPTTMAYGGENTRLFSCGTNPDGVSYLVEWDDSEGAIRRMYRGLAENSSDTVHFATSRNKYLAAGDDHVIKFWDMNHDELLMTADAGGGLPARPQVRFNKDGRLLAVVAAGYTIKILGSAR